MLTPAFNKYTPNIIIYSRSSGFSDLGPVMAKELQNLNKTPTNGGYFETLSLEVDEKSDETSEHWKNSDCLSDGTLNGKKLFNSIEAALTNSELYSLGFQ